MWGEVEKHKDLDALFVPSNVAKHRVPKKFSTKNPLQKFKQRKAKGLQPEPVRYDEENDEDADNEEDSTSESDKDEYQQPIDKLELMMMMIVMLTLNQMIVFHHTQNLLFQFAKYFLCKNDEGKIENTTVQHQLKHQVRKK